MSQHRQRIREQLGVLEERLEELGAFASANELQAMQAPAPISFGSDLLLQDALDSMRDLGLLVHEQQLLKSVSAHDFLRRIVGLLVQDAASQGCDIAVSHYGEGKITMEIAELVMGAILAAFRASLRSHKTFTRSERLKNHLFPTGSIFLDVRASTGEFQFRLIDDGRGFADSAPFQKLREHIARCGGWFGHSAFEQYGGMIEFKVPLAQNRLETLILRQGNFEILIPCTSVAEIAEKGGENRVPPGTQVMLLDETFALLPGGGSAPVLLRVVVADFQFWIACDVVVGRAKVRRISASEFVEPGSWLQHLGVFHEDGVGRALPLLEGSALVQFHKVRGGTT